MSYRPSILVIDDDTQILDLLDDLLSPRYQVSKAHDVLEAAGYLTTEPVDLLIADLGMPVVDGVQLIEKVRANTAYRRLPILVISAFYELIDSLKGVEVQGIFRKPFSTDELMNRVNSLLTN